MRGELRSEAQLQQQCVLWWKNTYPEKGRRLFAVINEGQAVTLKLGVGMTPGVCDLLYVDDDGYLWGIELKFEGAGHKTDHLRKQARWMMDVLPGRAVFIDNFNDFQSFMLRREGGTKPEVVKAYLDTVKAGSIVWRNELWK